LAGGLYPGIVGLSVMSERVHSGRYSGKGEVENMPRVLLVTSLDTRPDEAAYRKTLLEEAGCVVAVVDISMREHTQSGADYTCSDVAREGKIAFREVSSHKGTADIIEPMLKGCTKIAKRLYEDHSIDVICGFGGASNTLFLSSVMRTLPFGFPKLILSSSAAVPAYAGDYYGFKDIAADSIAERVCTMTGSGDAP